MVVRVISDDVALVRHPADQVRRGLEIVSHDKKARRRVVRLQGVQNFRRVPVFISRVKGQVDDVVLCVCNIDRVVFPQRLLARVSDGLFSFRAEDR